MTIPLSEAQPISGGIFTSVKRATAVDAVHDKLLTAIAVGAYSPGDALPPERDLAPMLDVSRATLRQAIERLVEQGLLESLRPSETGAFMAIDGMRAEAIVSEAGRLVEAAEQQGITPVMACSPQLRLPLMKLLKAGARRINVLSYTEISGSTAQIETMGVVNGAYAGAA